MNTKGNVILILVTIIAIGAIATAGYFFTQNQKFASSPTASATPSTSAVVNASSTPLATLQPSPTPAGTSTVVVFEQKASISAVDLDQLQKRVVDPYLDYHAEVYGNDYVVTFTISHNTQASKAQYPYMAKGIFKNGAFNDFLIVKDAQGIGWWVPECLNGCQLSESFKAKYPQIAAQVQ